MKTNKKTSLKDLASSIGVSTALVSMVLNGKAKQYRIGEEMTQKVLSIAKEMNYSPNLAAQNLRGGKTQLIGFVVTDISNPFFSIMTRVIENRAIELGYTVILGSSDEKFNNTKRLIDILLNKGVDGLIVVPCDGSEKIIEELHENKIPIVLIDRNFPNLDVSYSCLNNYKATVLATEHLIEQGYKNIALIAYKSDMSNVIDRIKGYEDSMKKAKFADYINVKRVSIVNAKIEVVKAITQLRDKVNPEAIIFSTNMISIQGLYCLNDMNIKIPEDIAVVGFDENDVFNLFYSPITCIKQPIEQIAIEAVNILVDKMKIGEYAKKSMIILEPELVVNKSSSKIFQ